MDSDTFNFPNPTHMPHFFRDTETFQLLQNEVLPALLTQAEHLGKTLRLWSADCATGEDAYSLAMLVADLLGDALPLWNIRIFATDQTEAMLNFAGQGIYPEDCRSSLTDEQSARLFERVNQGYRVSCILRDMIIFGQHNITRDIPFARMDLIMCRGILNTCSLERQQELARLFAFSLAPRHGYLVLGRSENLMLSSFNYKRVSETSPIYQSISETSMIKKTPAKDSSASLLAQLLQDKAPPSAGKMTAPPLSLEEVLFRLAPTGIVVIDRAYRIIIANRAAHRLCSLPDNAHLQDFFHSVAGLPYTSVRPAIDTTFLEGNAQNIPEIELTLTEGGNGRVLSMQFSLLPTEVTTPNHVVIYIQEVTEHVMIKQSYQNMRQAFQNLQLNYTTLTQEHKALVEANEQQQETSTKILYNYERLQISFEECQAAKEALEQDQAELQAELETVYDALLLHQNIS